MNLAELFCPNIACPARGQQGQGNIGVHSQKERRCICNVCGQTFATTKGTLFYRLRTDPKIVIMVITLLVYGCPVQAIVQAFALDERTVKNWWQRAGSHCAAVHEHTVGQSQLDLGQVQADEIKVKVQGGSIWMAFAMMVPTRLWLGGALSRHRDKKLIQTVVAKVRAVALCRPLLFAVDGLPSYVTAFRSAFRSPLPRRGQAGRPRLIAWPEMAIVQVVKQRAVKGGQIRRRIVQGGAELVTKLIDQTQGGGGINTAYIERLNATFRQCLPWLTRRTRTLAQQSATLAAAMYTRGCVYNFCDYHQSLRLRLSVGEHDFRWVQRTPALAAGLTDHRWTVGELLSFKVPPAPWQPPKRRGRPSQATLRLIERWCP